MKKLITILLAAMLLAFAASACADALPMVVDNAGLFTASEIAEMETIITRIRTTYQFDAVVLTTRLPGMSDNRVLDYADSWFDNNGYGMGEERSGFLFLIDMGNRVPCISTSGDMIIYLTDSRRSNVLNEADTPLRNGEYGRAAIAVLNRMERYLATGKQEGSFLYDSVTGQRISGVVNVLTPMEMLIAIAAGLAVMVIITLTVLSRYTLKNATYHFNRQTQTAAMITINDERFIRESVQRFRRDSDGPGGPGGHGGHGGGPRPSGRGASVHHSSSGRSHGGGVGRHF